VDLQGVGFVLCDPEIASSELYMMKVMASISVLEIFQPMQ
jgi:hypothetical protein